MAKPSIRMLWGIAKSPELSLSNEDLHLIVYGHTGKDSIKELNQREIRTVMGVLLSMKDSASGNRRKDKPENGNETTANQRKKVYKLMEELGWDKQARINGLCRKMFQVERLEWLNYQQCSKLIEALKSMVERKEKENEKI